MKYSLRMSGTGVTQGYRLANMSHETGTPLNSILGKAGILLETTSAPDPAADGKQHSTSQALSTLGGTLEQVPARILIVEDNIVNQHVMLGILKKLGLGADVAANGADALKALEMRAYDLVLMDVQMPKMDGLQATRIIRDLRSGVLSHQTPIVGVTANALDGDREECLEAGMDDYISKPVDMAVLIAAVEKWLGPAMQNRQSQGGKAKEPVAFATATQIDKTQVFDHAALLRRVMDDKELARTVLDIFLRDIPGQIQQLKSSAASGDANNVALQAHKIKGACATVGGNALRDLTAGMERDAKAGNIAIVSDRIAELDAQFLALKEEIQYEKQQ